MDGGEGGNNAGKLWKIKKKLSPKPQNTPTAMIDKTGNLVSSTTGLEVLVIEHYKKVLENSEIKLLIWFVCIMFMVW